MKKKATERSKKYLIALAEQQSILALCAGLLLLVCTFAAIIIWVDSYDGTEEPPLHYFTALSNLMSALAASFMIPYAVDGIRKKHFVLPRYIVLFQFSAATCVSVTMLTSLVLILPTQGVMAVQGTNFWLHIITPLCAVILFQCVETGVSISKREAILCLIPFWIYIAVYFVMVVIVGEERGGWSDFYMARAFWPAWISIIMFLIVGFVMAMVLRLVHNRRAVQFWNRVSMLWTEDTLPEEMLVEAFGLGRYVGRNVNSETELSVPVSLFEKMSETFGLSVEKLINAYIYGALDSLRQKGNG